MFRPSGSLFWNIWCFIERFFLQKKLFCSLRIIFLIFLAFLIFDQNRPFYIGLCLCMMGFARWSINKMVSFLEYLGFSRAFFCTEQLLSSCRIVVRMFLAFLIFCWPFCKGYSLCIAYSLCKMADFQNGLFFRIFGDFSCGFLHRTTLLLLRKWCELFLFWFELSCSCRIKI